MTEHDEARQNAGMSLVQYCQRGALQTSQCILKCNISSTGVFESAFPIEVLIANIDGQRSCDIVS